MRNALSTLVFLFSLSSLAIEAPRLPASWIVSDGAAPEPDEEGEQPVDPDEGVGPDAIASVDSILAVQARAIGESAAPATPADRVEAFGPRPGDWVPWRLAYFATDLGLSASGWVGALVNKGSSSVTLYWRKQGPKPEAPTAAPEEDRLAARVSSASTPTDLAGELEPAIRSALSTGRIRDEARFRANLIRAAVEFRDAASRLEGVSHGEWWVSRLRTDLTVDASGKLGPITSVGAEVRVRLEWHRLMRENAAPALPAPVAATLGAPLTVMGTSRFAEGLLGLASGVVEDLDAAVDRKIEKRGFKAYSYRVGVGVSAKGDVGVAQTTSSLIAHLVFARKTARPVVYPTFAALRSPATVPLIASSGDDGVVKLDRKRFRKGLRKAVRIGRFFAKRAEKIRVGKWKVYDLRTGFEISAGGKTGVAKVNALGATSINFYNQNF